MSLEVFSKSYPSPLKFSVGTTTLVLDLADEIIGGCSGYLF